MLTPEDLAYMREVQQEHQPTRAVLHRRVQARAADGGAVDGYPGEGEPIQVRIDGTPDKVPAEVGERLEGGTAAQVSAPFGVDLRSGDRLTVSPTEVYVLVSDGTPDAWATAQVVWTRRTVHPSR